MDDAPHPTALIAEDEPLLAAALKAELARAWPRLEILATVGDGLSAVAFALKHRPDVLFFDIRMPGMSGLEAAAELANAWDTSGQDGAAFPALVFVTAYDQYAVEAFEAQAIDYLLKPVQSVRLAKTVAKMQQLLASRRRAEPASHTGLRSDPGLDQTLAQLRQLLASPPGAAQVAPPLTQLQVSIGNAIRMVPLDQVLYFEAADKYVRVLTVGHEYLIRTPLRDLLPQLDTHQFWQIHRATVVRAGAIDTVTRDDAGKLWLQLHSVQDKLAVSRLYAYLFKAM